MSPRTWAFWRRVQYATGALGTILAVGLVVFVVFFNTPPTCFDGAQNGGETGVDCGGSCQRLCSAEVVAPTVKWSRSFRVSDGQYNAVAYVENQNQLAAAPVLRYIFSLYDDRGLITERAGQTILPPNSVYPIFEQRIATGDRVPTQTFIEIETPEQWLPATADRSQFRVVSREIRGADTSPRLEAVIENSALTEARDVEVVATIFDAAGNALTASRTFIDRFAPRSQEQLVFTWPEPIATTVRSCEVPSDIVLMLDRSGSMAADGGDPPEPLESAKRAAQSFVAQLRDRDQVAVLSYATTPSNPLEQLLTSDKRTASLAIAKTAMGTDGTQYTNMGDAFAAATGELESARHRADARKAIILLTDGDVTRPLNAQGARDIEYAAAYARTAAKKAHEAGVIVYTIGFGDAFSTVSGVTRDTNLIRDLASDPGKYHTAPTVADLTRVYREIATDLCEDGIAVIDIVPKTPTSFAPVQ